jgi:adenosylmethionine-8-amino-7-oxononanoate aminotransferase
MVGIELVHADRTPYAYEEAIGARVCAAVRKRGVILRPLGPVVVLMPPLSISLEEIDRLVAATAESIAEVC